MYDRKVRAVLEQAGWYEGRKIDISQQLAILKKCGFEVFDTAIRFLQEYDQLKLEHTAPFYVKFDNTKSCYDIFDIIKVSLLVNAALKNYQERTIPIGFLSDGEMTLFITETGKIITETSVIGDTIEDSIENIIKNTNGYPIKSYFINQEYTPMAISGFCIEDTNTLVEYTGEESQVIIPSSVINVGNAAFYENKSINTVDLNGTLSKIGAATFCQCTNLKFIDIPDSVHNIGYSSFYGCSSLTNVSLPSSLTEICRTTFCKCISLSSIILPMGIKKIMNGAFFGCKSIKNFIIPKSVETIGRYAFDSCTGLKTVEFQNGINKIFPFAFYNCKSLENIILPDSIESVGECAFDECDNLKTISIPETLKDIRKDAFGNARIILRRTAK